MTPASVTPPGAATGDATIAVVGPGRMGTGVSQVFAAAGHEVRLLDAKDRDPGGFERTEASVREEIRANLDFLVANDQFGGDPDGALGRIEFETDPTAALAGESPSGYAPLSLPASSSVTVPESCCSTSIS